MAHMKSTSHGIWFDMLLNMVLIKNLDSEKYSDKIMIKDKIVITIKLGEYEDLSTSPRSHTPLRDLQ